MRPMGFFIIFFFQAEAGIRDAMVTGVQTCALPISRFGVPDDEVAAVVERSRQSRRELIVTAKAYWTDVAVPELRAGYEHIDRIDVEGASPPALAAEWERAWSLVERAWRIHFFAIAAAYQVLEDLADRYESLVPEAAAG